MFVTMTAYNVSLKKHDFYRPWTPRFRYTIIKKENSNSLGEFIIGVSTNRGEAREVPLIPFKIYD